ncbi:hypothetical protein SDC9_137859 [bioreactor metagenome]|uniref:Uncharacterized protein n=1 Tax=bioreactor metagenome TaxID=1076179 RepID=A0A645DN70_9ZZZZ
MQWLDSQSKCDRQEDRSKNQNAGTRIHDHTHEEQEDVEQQEEYILVAGQTQHEVCNQGGNALDGQDLAKQVCHSDDQQGYR